MKHDERRRRRQIELEQLEQYRQRIRELEARAVCRELTKGKIDAKANLNIIGDEAIIEVEETVPAPISSCKTKMHHHKKHRHHHKKPKSNCGCSAADEKTEEKKQLEEESSCVKKETALAIALAKEADEAKQRCACELGKPFDPIKVSVDSTKDLSQSMDLTKNVSYGLVMEADKPKGCANKSDSEPI